MIFRRCLPNILFPVFMDASFFTAPHLHLPNLLIRACLHGVEGPQLGEVTRLGGVINPPVHIISHFNLVT